MDTNTKIIELINAKRLGLEHSAADIYWLINYLDKIPDYQISAWLMAVCLNGLTKAETVELTRAMAFSGHVLTLQRHAECELDHEHEVDLEQTFGKSVIASEAKQSTAHDDCCHEHEDCRHGGSMGIASPPSVARNDRAEQLRNDERRKRRVNRGFVDKHSTGGVGDKTSLVLGPLLAAVGFKVSKFSGRALGHTGGTVDKLEAIPGFRTDISMKQFETQIEQIGIALGAQTEEFAPADKRLYSLRDKTGTVESIPLIASSVMSKKIAGGADHIILDVKVGAGAFMKNLRDAEKLARTMKDIGTALNLNVQVLLTNMDRPLGATVGNSLEVLEAISVLKGYKNFEAYLAERHPERSEGSLCIAQGHESDFYKLCLDLASTICDRQELIAALESGEAYAKFLEFVRAQSDADTQFDAMGIASATASPRNDGVPAAPCNDGVPAAPCNDGDNDLLGADLDVLIASYNKPMITYTAVAESSGYITEINAKRIGELIHELGYSPREMLVAAGHAESSSRNHALRENPNYTVDNSAGLILHKTVGDKLSEGEPLFTVSAADAHKLNSVKLSVLDAIKFSKTKPGKTKLVYKKI